MFLRQNRRNVGSFGLKFTMILFELTSTRCRTCAMPSARGCLGVFLPTLTLTAFLDFWLVFGLQCGWVLLNPGPQSCIRHQQKEAWGGRQILSRFWQQQIFSISRPQFRQSATSQYKIDRWRQKMSRDCVFVFDVEKTIAQKTKSN